MTDQITPDDLAMNQQTVDSLADGQSIHIISYPGLETTIMTSEDY